MPSNLTRLQEDFLRAFFEQNDMFYLTGGGALIGYYGWPRQTNDLDLFSTAEGAMAQVDAVVDAACVRIGATTTRERSSSYFRRYRIVRDADVLQADLVHETSPQAHPQKVNRDGVVVDPLEEIFANKICTLVGRAEVRDFWDVYQFMRRGFSLDDGLRDAALKEGGVDAENLLFVLQDVHWPACEAAAREAGLPDFEAVSAYFRSLIPELARRLLPPPHEGQTK